MSSPMHFIPPPPPSMPTSQGKNNIIYTHIKPVEVIMRDNIGVCCWALKYPELQMACYRAHVCLHKAPRMCQYRETPSILQEGPTCGLTAISMILNGTPSTDELLATAKELNFSNNGEMFSAQYMLSMLEKVIATTNLVPTLMCEMHEGALGCEKIKEQLLGGACLFVPYDSDYNHEPCLRSGHSAHWALIIGYLIDLHDQFYVLARHGKSKNLGVWLLSALSESNSNLTEFAQPKAHPDCDFILPPGGIDGNLGLKDRAIIVNGLPHHFVKVR